MNEPILALTTHSEHPESKKYFVQMSPRIGRRDFVLVDHVYFKDGFVVMEGVTSMEVAQADIRPEKVFHYGFYNYKLEINSNSASYPDGVEYGYQMPSLVVDRKNVGRIEGVASLDDIVGPWFKTRDEARKEMTREQEEINKKALKRNARDVDGLSECHRASRACMKWEGLPWITRLFTNKKRFIDNFPASDEDRKWVLKKAEELGIEYDKHMV